MTLANAIEMDDVGKSDSTTGKLGIEGMASGA
jgi:hypothetical protein